MHTRGWGTLALCGIAVVSCKKESASEAPAAAAVKPAAPRVPTVTRYAGGELQVWPSRDGGAMPIQNLSVDVMTAVEVVDADAGYVEYFVDGGSVGFLQRAMLLSSKPPTAESMTELVKALARGDGDGALNFAARAVAVSPKDAAAVGMLAALKARTGTAAVAKVPALEPLEVDAAAPATGATVFVAMRELPLRAQASAAASAESSVRAGASLEVTDVQGDWLEVRATAAAADAGDDASDAGEAPDAGTPAAPPHGWIEKAAVSSTALDGPTLLKLAETHAAAKRSGSAARALELASALAPDDVALLGRAIEADIAAGRFEDAVALSESKPDTSYVKHVQVTFVFGCRGNRKKVDDVLDAENLPKKVPPNACITAPKWSSCIECWTPSTERNSARRKANEASRREQLRKRFPDGPFLRASLSFPAPQGMKGFFFEVPYEYEQGRCEEYTLSSEPVIAVVSEPTRLPRSLEEAQAEVWYETTKQHAIYGFMVARSSDDVKRALMAFGDKKGTMESDLAPEPNDAMEDDDRCPDCNGCGD